MSKHKCGAQPRYVMIWQNKWVTASAVTLEDMVGDLKAAAATLDAMLKTGKVFLEGGAEDDRALLVTGDQEVAEACGFDEDCCEEGCGECS